MKLSKILFSLAALTALLLAGCASTSSGYLDGYSTEYQIGPNKWVCYYQGNPYMHEVQVMDYGINQCAAVTILQGFKYYKILDVQKGGTTTSQYIPGTPTVTSGTVTPYGVNAISYGSSGSMMTSTRNSLSVTIECFNEPAADRLNAREVWDAFKAREWPGKYGHLAKPKTN